MAKKYEPTDYRGQFSGWGDRAEELALDDVYDTYTSLESAVESINLATEADLGTLALNNRAISLLNRSIDLRDAVASFHEQVVKKVV